MTPCKSDAEPRSLSESVSSYPSFPKLGKHTRGRWQYLPTCVGLGLRQCKPGLVNTVGSSSRSRWLSHQTALTQNLTSHPAVAARNAGAAICVPHFSKAAAFLSCNHLGQSGLEQWEQAGFLSAVDSKASWLRFKSRRHRYVQNAERRLTAVLGKLCLQNCPLGWTSLWVFPGHDQERRKCLDR